MYGPGGDIRIEVDAAALLGILVGGTTVLLGVGHGVQRREERRRSLREARQPYISQKGEIVKQFNVHLRMTPQGFFRVR